MWIVPEITQEYIERMEDVLDLYAKPFEKRLPIEVKKSGQIKKRDSEYVRCGTANIFCAIEPKAGVHITKVTKLRRGPDFAKMLSNIRDQYPNTKTIHFTIK